jgi:sodium-dependent dicarboxylate transporter 2/3/5
MVKKTLIVFLALVLFAAAFMVPSIDAAQKVTLGIFFVAIVLWVSEIIPLYVTALIILLLEAVVLSPVSGISYQNWVNSFFSPILLLFLGGFVLASGMKAYRIDEAIANVTLSRIGDRPYAVLMGFMVVTAVLSMWVSNTASTALMIAVALPLIERAGRFKKAIILGIPFSASLGGMGTPIGTPPNAIAIGALKKMGMTMTFTQWMIRTIPLVIVLILMASAVLYLLFPPETKRLALAQRERIVIRGKSLTVFLVVVATALLWILSPVHHISSNVIALFPVIALFGTGILGRERFRQLEWDVLILMGGGLALGEAIGQTGLGRWFMGVAGVEGMSPALALGIFVLITTLLSNIMSNTSATALIIPIVVSTLTGTGVPFAIALSASAALIFPISTPPNAIAYGSGHITIRDMAVGGAVINFIAIIVIYFLSLYLWGGA